MNPIPSRDESQSGDTKNNTDRWTLRVMEAGDGPDEADEAWGWPDPYDARQAALEAFEAGLAVLPPREDGSKRPDGGLWGRYQDERPSIETILFWYGIDGPPRRSGCGVVGGAVSGNLELFEFDACGRLYAHFRSVAIAMGYGDLIARLDAGYHDLTPTQGHHWFYRCSEISGNTVLARYESDEINKITNKQILKPLIETRGEGGYAITAPSNGRVHPTGGTYVRLAGSFATIPTITPEERKALWDLARSFDETPVEPKPDPWVIKGAATGEVSPWEAFNARTSWEELLEPRGWVLVYERDDVQYWRRPGKDHGHSATTNHGGTGRLKVFSSSTEFDNAPGVTYSKFGAFCLWEHQGDWRAGIKALKGTRPAESARVEATETNDEDIEVVDRWPKIKDVAYHGVAGALVDLVRLQTEADPVAILVQFLIGFGNLIDRGPHFMVGADVHHMNEFTCIVGPSSTARKGMSQGLAYYPFTLIDLDWVRYRNGDGLVSGEGLIYHVRDKRYGVDKRGNTIVEDLGVHDKRLVANEPEFSRVLSISRREGNTLSAVLRNAWDGKTLRNQGKKAPDVATDAHISVVAHATMADLEQLLDPTSMANGFANRFLWMAARRRRIIPNPPNVDTFAWADIIARVRKAVNFARSCGELTRDREADEYWNSVYPRLTSGATGLLGSITSRAEAHAMRFAGIYAILDLSRTIKVAHLEPAIAVVDYNAATVAMLFADAIGDPKADRLIKALREAPDGLTRTEITAKVFGGNLKREEIAKILGRLLTQGQIHRKVGRENGKKPTERWFAGGADDATN